MREPTHFLHILTFFWVFFRLPEAQIIRNLRGYCENVVPRRVEDFIKEGGEGRVDDGWTAHGILKFGGKKRRDKIYCRFPLAHPISARASSPAASPTKRRFLERRDAPFFSKAAYCTWTPTVTSLSALSLSPISHLEAGILNHRDGKQR